MRKNVEIDHQIMAQTPFDDKQIPESMKAYHIR